MKLSAAIRIGSMTTKQIYMFFTDGGTGRCALGAAMDACGMDIKPLGRNNYLQISAKWPIANKLTQNPVTGVTGLVRSIIWELNDIHGWTRETISDWVETIEQQEERKSVRHEVKRIIHEVCR